MGILAQFGESLTLSSNAHVDPAVLIGFALFVVFFSLIAGAALYIIVALCLARIFKKAGVEPWIAWVPIYNGWKMLEIGGQQGYWAVLAIFPVISIVSAVYIYIAMYHIGKKLGKDATFVLVGICLPIVWYIWLAVDKSRWHDKASSARSLAK